MDPVLEALQCVLAKTKYFQVASPVMPKLKLAL